MDLSRLIDLETRLAAVLPEGAAVACTDPRAEADESDLFAAEAAAMARAVPARKREFSAGRRAAHRAMTALGHLPAPVPMAPDRAPLWPDGLVGSISHCETACAAVLGPSRAFRALAVDLEEDADLAPEVVPMVCLPEERAWLDRQPETARGRWARVIFAAKECGYKLQYPLTGAVLDFDAARVEIAAESGQFELRFRDPAPSLGSKSALRGRFGRVSGVMFCVMYAVQ